MTGTARKIAKPVTPKPEAKSAAAAGKSPLLQAPTSTAPKPARKRSPAVAKVEPTTEKALATPIPAARKFPVKPASRVAKEAVEIEPKEAKPGKAKKAKLVRDSFTMPELEYAAIASLKKRCLNLGVAAKKSEILRAAISTLAKLSDADVAAAIQGLEVIKTGRPAKGGK
jgi:hypothetical protein